MDIYNINWYWHNIISTDCNKLFYRHQYLSLLVLYFFRVFWNLYIRKNCAIICVHFIRPSVCPSVPPSVRPFVRLSVRPSIHPSVNLFVHPSVRSFIRPIVRKYNSSWTVFCSLDCNWKSLQVGFANPGIGYPGTWVRVPNLSRVTEVNRLALCCWFNFFVCQDVKNCKV